VDQKMGAPAVPAVQSEQRITSATIGRQCPRCPLRARHTEAGDTLHSSAKTRALFSFSVPASSLRAIICGFFPCARRLSCVMAIAGDPQTSKNVPRSQQTGLQCL
jgi:hypothetical protein